jgi:hypothetical protein
MIKTPLPPRGPYRAAPTGPLSTLMLSIIFGSKLLKVPVVEITSSITIKAPLPPDTEANPLKTMSLFGLTPEPVWLICKPETLPANA